MSSWNREDYEEGKAITDLYRIISDIGKRDEDWLSTNSFKNVVHKTKLVNGKIEKKKKKKDRRMQLKILCVVRILDYI